jgi:preprotein translocase subunit SecB
MPQIAIHNIQLQHIRFDRNPNFYIEHENSHIPIRYNISIEHEYHQAHLIVHVKVKSPGEEEDRTLPFYFEIVIAGDFKLIGEVEDSMIHQYANINCPAIIFPYLREILADITRRAGFPPLHLQPVNFMKLNKRLSVQEKSAAVKKIRKKKASNL